MYLLVSIESRTPINTPSSNDRYGNKIDMKVEKVSSCNDYHIVWKAKTNKVVCKDLDISFLIDGLNKCQVPCSSWSFGMKLSTLSLSLYRVIFGGTKLHNLTLFIAAWTKATNNKYFTVFVLMWKSIIAHSLQEHIHDIHNLYVCV